MLLRPETYTRWSLSGHRNLMLSLQMEGVWVMGTEDVNDTVSLILDMARWCEKKEHTTLKSRPKPRGAWGAASDRDFQLHTLQSIPGIGPGQAEKILDHFGRLPIAWTVDKKELLAVPGMGKVKVDRAWAALGEVVQMSDTNDAVNTKGDGDV